MAILAAIDEQDRSRQVVEIAHDLARTYDDRLIALHVIPTDDYLDHKASLEEIPEFSDFSVTQEMESARNIARRFVTETVEDVGVEFEPRGRVGDVAEKVLAEAADVEPRYLVISGRRRSPTGKVIFGSVAQQILLNADCPVVSKLSDA